MIKLKKHPIILAVIILVVLVLVGAGCGKYSSPEKTYSLYIKAMEKGDVDAYLECFTEESQEMLKPEIKKLTPEALKRMANDHKKAGYKIIEKTDDMAVMALEAAEAGVLIFKKEKGEWKVDITVLKRDAKRITDLMGTLRSGALEFYWDQHGGYPVLIDTSEDGEFLKILVDDGYLVEMLLDPLHPKYFYEYEGTENSYTLKCYCETEGGYCDMADGVKDHVFIYSYSLERAVDETADWKVYKNEKYGYEIKYPQDWKTKERSLMSDLGHRDFVWIQSNGDEFNVDVWDFSFYSYNQLTEPPGGIDPDTIEKKEITIDGQPATEFSYIIVGDAGSGSREGKQIFV